MKTKQKNNLAEQWKKDETAHFEGWDFSYITTRMKQQKPSWNYIQTAKKLVKQSNAIIDIDTGGGEVLSKIVSPNQKKVYAIEGYKPNVQVARKNLKKIGVKVFYADSAHKFHFKDETFDLVLNRHGAINAKEIYRVLKKGGVFFTQQVDTKKNLVDLIKTFKGKPKWTFNNLKYRKKELESTGFKILKSKEWRGKIFFKDVGAIVYFLKSTAWLINNFSVKSHLKQLKMLQEKTRHKKELTFTLAKFMMLARKPKNK